MIQGTRRLEVGGQDFWSRREKSAKVSTAWAGARCRCRCCGRLLTIVFGGTFIAFGIRHLAFVVVVDFQNKLLPSRLSIALSRVRLATPRNGIRIRIRGAGRRTIIDGIDRRLTFSGSTPTWGYQNHTDRWFMNDDSHHVIIDESFHFFVMPSAIEDLHGGIELRDHWRHNGLIARPLFSSLAIEIDVLLVFVLV
jgi:hypothetical protein